MLIYKLRKAIDNKDPLAMALIVSEGVDLNVRYTETAGATPLIYAINSKAPDDIVTLLLDLGADISSTDMFFNTPLHKACLSGRYEVAKILVSQGANVGCKNGYIRTPLHVLCQQKDHEDHKRLAILLINNGVDVNAKDSAGQTALYHASLLNSLNAVNVLLNRGADPNIADEEGKTPLHVSGKKGFIANAAFLIRSGANINAQDEKGNTPLHYACLFGSVQSIDFLLENKANTTIQNLEGKTAYNLAERKSLKDVFLQRA